MGGFMTVIIDGTSGVTTPGVVNTAAETIATTLAVTGVTTVQAGTAALPAITTTGDTNTGIFFPAADTIAFAEGGAEIARFDSSGNLGIGTTAPSAKLEVSGSGTLELARFATTTNNTPSIGIYSDGSIRAKLRASSAETALLSQGVTPLLLGINDTERARIDSSGNLLVGKTVSTSTTVGITLAPGGYVSIARAGTGAQSHIQFGNGNGIVGEIYTTGSSTVYSTSSDYRLKEDIQPMVGALAKVAALKPVTYKWKSDGSDGQGFIAHELQAVVPDCVSREKDAVDADGNPQYQGIDTSFLVATLTAAIQELKTIVDTQAARITALEAQIV